MINEERKRWLVEYDHADGRKGTVEVVTEVAEYGGFQYGNGKAGRLTTENGTHYGYDLRYSHGDLHKVMLDAYFGEGLVSATEQGE